MGAHHPKTARATLKTQPAVNAVSRARCFTAYENCLLLEKVVDCKPTILWRHGRVCAQAGAGRHIQFEFTDLFAKHAFLLNGLGWDAAPYGRGRSRHINAGRAAAANVGRLPEFCPTGAGGTMDDRAAQNLFWNRMSSSLSSGQVWFSSGSTLFRLNGSAKSGSGRGYESCRKLASAALSRRLPKNGQSAPRTASEPGRDCLPAGRMYPYSRNREKPGLAIGRRKKRCAQLDYSLMAAPRFSRS